MKAFQSRFNRLVNVNKQIGSETNTQVGELTEKVGRLEEMFERMMGKVEDIGEEFREIKRNQMKK